MASGKPGQGDSAQPAGAFKRRPTAFHDEVGSERFPAEVGRYHLTISHACPWAHRTMITRALKGLDHVFSVSVVHWLLDQRGWSFDDGDGVVPHAFESVSLLRDLYALAGAPTPRPTVPVFWDSQHRTIVNNESSEIIRFLDTAFQDHATRPWLRLSPEHLLPAIDTVNASIYDHVNNGVYKAGFASSQHAHDAAVRALFAELDRLEERLSGQRWLTGDAFTEADVRLFTTLIRFDPVYHTHFKCSRKRIIDYPNLWAYTREIAQVPEIRATIDLDHIRKHYYISHTSTNPRQLVAELPAGWDLDAPHDRGRLGGRGVLERG